VRQSLRHFFDASSMRGRRRARASLLERSLHRYVERLNTTAATPLQLV
jgi:hypothetical protein